MRSNIRENPALPSIHNIAGIPLAAGLLPSSVALRSRTVKVE